MFSSVLVVCTANICRSPVAEVILRNTLPGVKVDSAGVDASTGQSVDPTAAEYAQSNGLSLEGHKAKKFTATIGHQYDLILVMEPFHLEKISHIAPEVRGKTMYLGHWLGKKEIPDPYGKSKESVEFVYELIKKSCQSWVEKIIE